VPQRKLLNGLLGVGFGKFQELAYGSNSLKFLTLSLGRKPTIFEGVN